MPNYGNYYIGIRLLLLKEYLQANAGPKRPIKRKDLQAYLLGVIFNCSGGQFSALTMEGKLVSDST